MSDVICPLLGVFGFIVFARVVIEWFPAPPGGFTALLRDGLRLLTDWILVPARRVIPPVGMIDISPLVVIFFVFVLQRVICN